MDSLLKKIGDDRLMGIAGSINPSNVESFNEIPAAFPGYDYTFLWVICYQHEGNEHVAEYINANYEKYHQVLDSRFLRKLISKGNFNAHMWEMILCDALSSAGKLISKEKSGADFWLKTQSGQIVQVEAVSLNESDDLTERSERPMFAEDNTASLGGEIEAMERPVSLRFIKGFDGKHDEYNKDMPLLIAINTSKAVGMISDDNYVLRRMLFGLGYVTITQDGRTGLQQNLVLNKPGEAPFSVGRFRDQKYSHVSGVIYTSQKAHALVPEGYGWHNQGVTFSPNPNATYQSDVEFPFFKKLFCTETLYQEADAEYKFKSNITL